MALNLLISQNDNIMLMKVKIYGTVNEYAEAKNEREGEGEGENRVGTWI